MVEIGGLKSPWRSSSSPPVRQQEPKGSSEKIYECCWDLMAHGTLLSLMNVVTFVAINFFKEGASLSLKQGVVQAGVTTVTYLAFVEGINHSQGNNMRKMHYFSLDRIKALVGAILFTPILMYGHEKILNHRQISFLPIVGIALWNGVGLFTIPHL